jgi:hypothetical protein
MCVWVLKDGGVCVLLSTIAKHKYDVVQGKGKLTKISDLFKFDGTYMPVF